MTHCYGDLESPHRTGPHQQARGCALGRCPARLLKERGVVIDVEMKEETMGKKKKRSENNTRGAGGMPNSNVQMVKL